jgi:predicted permease
MLNDLLFRFRSLLRRSTVEKELDEELRFHLEQQVQKHVRSGLTREQAVRRSRLEFGGTEQVREDCREARGIAFIDVLAQDVRYGLRMFRRNPGFAAVVVGTLALGIGANTAIFSLINAALLKMLPVRNAEQLVQFTTNSPTMGINDAFSYPAFKALREQNQVLSGVLAFRRLHDVDVEVNGKGGLANGQAVSGDYFLVLGVQAVLGRTFTREDEKAAGQNPVAVISYSYWRERFALDPNIIGTRIAVNNSPFTVIGVTPPEFFGVQPGDQVDVSVPITMTAQVRPDFSDAGSPYDVLTAPFRNWLYVMGRLRPEVSRSQAEARLQPVFRQCTREAAAGLSGLPFDSPSARRAFLQTTLHLDPGGQGLAALRQQFSKPLRILMAIVALLLLVTCANVANLMLARANARQREIAVRLAVGAGRRRLIRQLITESVMLAIAGGLLGLVLAFSASRSLMLLLAHARSPISLTVQPDPKVLCFTLLVSVVTALLFGLVPAWRAARFEVSPTLIQSKRGLSEDGGRSRLGKSLVVLQIAVSVVLMIGAGLLVRSLENLRDFYPGFDKDNVLLFSISPGMVGYKDAQLVPLYERLLDRLGAIPGVRSTTFSVHSPLSQSFSYTSVTVQGYEPRAGQELAPVGIEPVGPGYFTTMRTAVLLGRDFTTADRAGATKVAVINETMARHYFGSANPIGRLFSMPGYRGDPSWLEIVAVVKDAKYHDLREQPSPMAYIPLLQAPESGITFEVRTGMNPDDLMNDALRAVRATDSRLPVFAVRTLNEQLDDSLVEERLVASLSGMFGALAVVLACVGLYGLMAYAVSRRTNEIGIRIALGARRIQIAAMVLRETVLLVFVGLVLGIPSAMGASHLIRSEMYGLKPDDPVTLLLASSVMAGIAVLAGFLPARRAMRTDPMVALRSE